MTQIINGQALAKIIKNNITKNLIKLNQGDENCPQRPNLAIILVGKRADSELYVNLKEKEAKEVGIDTHIYKCSADILENEIFDIVIHLSNDDKIDAILVQLPLPKNFDTAGIIRAIDPKKDVDRFHPQNLEQLFKTCDHQHVIPPVHGAVLEILKSINCDLKNKQVIIIANSDIFGKSLAKVLTCEQAEVNLSHPEDKNLISLTKQADILISAIGQPKFIKANMIKKDAVIIDIGITKQDKKVLGDVDFNSVKDKASFITPVPGGVGPMTIAMLFKNTLELYKQRHR